ncbi:AAA family ATPase [candidate division KSB1 bacterium]|nr:AAA family ATPase [candidate division KSB1 bacterium]
MSVELANYEVPIENLRWNCPIDIFENQDEKNALDFPIIGQEKAIKALRLGIDLKQYGYNIIITGMPGSGRHTAVKFLLNEKTSNRKLPPDWCYVYNFKSPKQPKALSFLAGEVKKFKKDIDDLISQLTVKISSLFQGKFFQERRQKLLSAYEKMKHEKLSTFEKKINQVGIGLNVISTGAYTQYLLVDQNQEKMVSVSDMDVENKNLTIVPKASFADKQALMAAELHETLQNLRIAENELQLQLLQFEKELIEPLVTPLISTLKANYSDQKVREHLDAINDAIYDQIDLFKNADVKKNSALSSASYDPFWRFRINILIDNGNQQGAPVIFEETPGIINLFGTIERTPDPYKSSEATFLNIRAGSVLAANGGYLIVDLANVNVLPSFWIRLKQVLKYNALSIEPNYYSAETPVLTLRPEPIPLDLKVILIGEEFHYYSLLSKEDFTSLFKIRANFDFQTVKTPILVQQYAQFIRYLEREKKLLPFTPNGMAALVEEGVRIVENRTKLTTLMSRIADIAYEANYWAENDKSPEVKDIHVEMAIKESIARLNVMEEYMRERVLMGATIMDLSGMKVGQINSLTIRMGDDYEFGKPARLTVRATMGRSGIINIERDSDFSGRTHNKGLGILKGYFRGTYGYDKELNFTASLCFEQSYAKIDGDSASAAEVIVLLSGIADIPLRQEIGITGSMDQFGQIQPVGGVNEKIEGFYYLCQEVGLTGTQGVLIPKRNLVYLQLHRDIIRAVQDGQFHIYVMENINEGIEVMTGISAGDKLPDHTFPKGTVHFMVDEKLHEFNQKDKDED